MAARAKQEIQTLRSVARTEGDPPPHSGIPATLLEPAVRPGETVAQTMSRRCACGTQTEPLRTSSPAWAAAAEAEVGRGGWVVSLS